MAIRYSGDVEVRLTYGGANYVRGHSTPLFYPSGKGFYYAQIRAPYIRNAAILSLREVGLSESDLAPKSSEAYDTAAEAFLKWAELHVGELPLEFDDRNRIVVRRTFQSPCPVSSRR